MTDGVEKDVSWFAGFGDEVSVERTQCSKVMRTRFERCRYVTHIAHDRAHEKKLIASASTSPGNELASPISAAAGQLQSNSAVVTCRKF